MEERVAVYLPFSGGVCGARIVEEGGGRRGGGEEGRRGVEDRMEG